MKNYLAIVLQVAGFLMLIWSALFGYTLGNLTWFSEPNFVLSTYLQYNAMVMNAFLVMLGSLLLCTGLLLQCKELSEWAFVTGVAFFALFLVSILRLVLFPPNWGIPRSGFQLEMLVAFEMLFAIATGLALFGVLCFGLSLRANSRMEVSRSLSLFLMISILFVGLMVIRGSLSFPIAHGIIPYPVLGDCSILLLLPYSIGLMMTILWLYETKRVL